MELFTNSRVILAQGPCKSSQYRSNFSLRAAEVSTIFKLLNELSDYSIISIIL